MIYVLEADHTFIFPDMVNKKDGTNREVIQKRNPIVFIPNTKPEDCFDGVCEEVDNYPTEYIRELLSRTRAEDNYFINNDIPVIIQDRLKDEGETFCLSIRKVTFPKSAFNINKTEKFLVNTDEFKQGIVTETCV